MSLTDDNSKFSDLETHDNSTSIQYEIKKASKNQSLLAIFEEGELYTNEPKKPTKAELQQPELKLFTIDDQLNTQ